MRRDWPSALTGCSNGRIDACLVIGAEEIQWLSADALWHFDRRAVISGGAGGTLLEPESGMVGGGGT